MTVDRLQLVSIIAAAALFLVVLELVRRRRLMERYALLWLLAALVLIALAAWRGGLEVISRGIGVIYPPNAIFAVAVGFILLLLLHFSASVSRLSDQTKVLAQRNALLEERLRRLERDSPPEQPRSVEGAGAARDRLGDRMGAGGGASSGRLQVRAGPD
jgi:hypothetical protein